MKPYYDHAGITIYHGDCREILPSLPEMDFIWTDPPYNVGMEYGTWDDALPEDEYLDFLSTWIALCKQKTSWMAVYVPHKWMLEFWRLLGSTYRQIVMTYFAEGAIRYGFVNQFSTILTNAKPLIRTKNVWHDMQMPGRGFFFTEDKFDHPGFTSREVTLKVLESFARPYSRILDPFCGTGTTLRVAKDTLRPAIGIEIEEKYCEIAARRLSQEVMSF